MVLRDRGFLLNTSCTAGVMSDQHHARFPEPTRERTSPGPACGPEAGVRGAPPSPWPELTGLRSGDSKLHRTLGNCGFPDNPANVSFSEKKQSNTSHWAISFKEEVWLKHVQCLRVIGDLASQSICDEPAPPYEVHSYFRALKLFYSFCKNLRLMTHMGSRLPLLPGVDTRQPLYAFKIPIF